ncbi:hypothetical protein, partial [Shewanella glacialipiscicola]|uniref:hypothetical protein n=1 Tax=Shewanella glacialipiscicola TaxID=614069 RepID=UPI001C819282
NEINISNTIKSLNEYIVSLDSFYTTYTSDSKNSFLRYYQKFTVDANDKENSQFINEALFFANYDENSLNDDNVILFSSPMIVSELNCTDIPSDEKTSLVRLITFIGSDKKITTKRTLFKKNLFDDKDITKYEVHDVVLGFILPRKCNFHSIKLVSFDRLHTDHNQLERTQKALQKATDDSLIENHNIVEKLNDINSIINLGFEKFSLIEKDIQLLEQKKSYTENSLENNQKSLSQLSHDFELSSKTYEKIQNDISKLTNKLHNLQQQTDVESEKYKREKEKLINVMDESLKANDSLILINKELKEANKEKNLTTLDMVGHSNETSKQLRPYILLTLLTFAGLAWMAQYIYRNGENFVSLIPLLANISTLDILISRLPLVTATILIIGGLSGVLIYLVKHIVSLNTEKMTMLKAAILAEQITNSLDCKAMSEQDILEFKRDTKIKLIIQVFTKNDTELNKNNNNLIIEALKALNSK